MKQNEKMANLEERERKRVQQLKIKGLLDKDSEEEMCYEMAEMDLMSCRRVANSRQGPFFSPRKSGFSSNQQHYLPAASSMSTAFTSNFNILPLINQTNAH